jgi:prepilin-type N-terminal cleavage/methylation domain-containing protein
MKRQRAGFTLIELLIVAVLGSVVLMAAMGILITNQRVYTVNTATVNGQQSTRMAVDILSNELREISASGGGTFSL